MKNANVNVDYIQAFMKTNNAGMMINVGVNVKKQLIKECVIKDLFGILVIVSANVVNRAM